MDATYEHPAVTPEVPEPATEAAPQRSFWRAWGRILVLAVLAALIFRAGCIEAFKIPTHSMEKNLLIGDYLLVSKMHYGPRTPVSLGVPLTDWYVKDFTLPWVRLPGFSEVRRGDVVVFNYPVETRILDRRTHFVKRIVGLPGDTLTTQEKTLYVNGEPQPLQPGMQQQWLAQPRQGAAVPMTQLYDREVEVVRTTDTGGIVIIATTALAQELAAWEEIDAVEPYQQAPLRRRRAQRTFSFLHPGRPAVVVPGRGDTLHLSAINWPLYRDLLIRHEGQEARLHSNGAITIGGVVVETYVAQQDYYFVLGDNRDESLDSRVWGFVPADHLVGKALMTYFSWDAEAERVRWERLFRRVR